MKNGQITIRDLADRLNLSPATVSRALRDHPDISPTTKKRIQALARELDYHPNSIARSLKQAKTNTIGVIVPEIRHNFFSSALDGIEEVAYKAGYTIIVCKSNESSEREVINARSLVSNRIAGLLVSISQTTTDSSHFRSLLERNTPVVFFDRVCEDLDSSKVVVDDFGGAFEAVEHLIERGYKRIAHLAGPQHLSISRHRLEGYTAALQKHGLPVSPEQIVFGGLNEEDGARGLLTLLTRTERPDAVFAVNDPVAIGALLEMKKRKLKIPQDMALVGFSNNPISSMVEPALTTVDQPAYEIGRTAAQLLLEHLNGEEENPTQKTVTLKTKLIVRDST